MSPLPQPPAPLRRPQMAGKWKALEKAASILRPHFYARFAEVLKASSHTSGAKLWHPTAVIHPTAVVDDASLLDEDVIVGPFCHVGKGVALGSGCKLLSHVSIHSNTVVGNDTVIHPFASVGADPQDLKYSNEMHSDSWLILGQNNVVREHTSINRGTAGGGGTTSSGRNCLFMSSTHVSFLKYFGSCELPHSWRPLLRLGTILLWGTTSSYRRGAAWPDTSLSTTTPSSLDLGPSAG